MAAMSRPEKRGKEVFESKGLTEDQTEVIGQLKRIYADAHNYILDNVAIGRLRSTALTKLEESGLWAVKAVAHEGVAE